MAEAGPRGLSCPDTAAPSTAGSLQSSQPGLVSDPPPGRKARGTTRGCPEPFCWSVNCGLCERGAVGLEETPSMIWEPKHEPRKS